MDTHRFLELLAEKMESTATVKKVYGDPVEAYGKAVIPVAKVSYGLGGGFGKEKSHDAEGREEERPAGQSGGGGIMVSPVGVFELDHDGTRFVSLRQGRKARWAGAFVAGLVVGALLSGVRKLFWA